MLKNVEKNQSKENSPLTPKIYLLNKENQYD
jgi:hypothetical protein